MYSFFGGTIFLYLAIIGFHPNKKLYTKLLEGKTVVNATIRPGDIDLLTQKLGTEISTVLLM